MALLRRLLPGALGEAGRAGLQCARLSAACAAPAGAFRPDLIYERYNLYYLAGALAGAPHRHAAISWRSTRRWPRSAARFGGLRLRAAGACGWSGRSGARPTACWR